MLDRFEAFVTDITTCYKSIQRIKSSEMTEFGLKGTHVMCVFYLSRNEEGLTAARLCQLCGEDKAAVSRTLTELESKGYVESRQPQGKKYRALLFLTESGKDLAQQVNALIGEWVTAIGEGLTLRDRMEFYRILGVIAGNLKEKSK